MECLFFPLSWCCTYDVKGGSFCACEDFGFKMTRLKGERVLFLEREERGLHGGPPHCSHPAHTQNDPGKGGCEVEALLRVRVVRRTQESLLLPVPRREKDGISREKEPGKKFVQDAGGFGYGRKKKRRREKEGDESRWRSPLVISTEPCIIIGHLGAVGRDELAARQMTKST
ncbi:hypothetical protein INR49_013411, partial [Caranx melampygus]